MMTTRIYTVYAEHDDMTFIMKEKTDGYTRTVQVVGFYFGEPDDQCTNEYIGQKTAEIDEE